MPEIATFQPACLCFRNRTAGLAFASRYAVLLCVFLFALAGCIPKKSLEPAKTGNVQSAYAAPKSFCRFSMGEKQIGIPAPGGPAVKVGGDQLRQAASTWITPSENVFCVYEIAPPQKMRPGQAGQTSLRGRQVVIVSALPEFMDESVTEAQFRALRGDLTRSAGLWRDSAVADFLRMTKNYYKDRPGFTHSMGVYHSTVCTVSNVRLIKESDRPRQRKGGGLPTGTSGAKENAGVWDFSALLANPNGDVDATGAVTGSGGTLPEQPGEATPKQSRAATAAEAGKYFSGGTFTLSIRNLVYLRGKVFNIYYNVPVQSVDDIGKAMNGNAAYMDGVVKNAVGSGAAVSGSNPRRGGDSGPDGPDNVPQAVLSPIV